MEKFETNFESNDTISFDNEIKYYLLETAKWAKFLSIIGFIFIGKIVLIAIIMLFGKELFNNYSYKNTGSIIAGITYILIAVVHYFPINYLYKFSVSIEKSLKSNNQKLFTSGLRNLRTHTKFVGILTIVYFVIVVFGLLGLMMLATI